ncbi:hypothetical protein NTCA1_33570 [Novosphingobium sp. TCA1]|uniref:SnoaL-like domain-containing protein n=2 Tax=Novosphingobium TaxID=165696 RepID=A0A2W5QQE4_9SPHN|nr:MAG: hypothetical protein DI555_15460 [Novosphingobium pentaromativorans]GFE75708.1 hypothetical protein NTCA1_33570 [Novosphingobium sp. TCA1]
MPIPTPQAIATFLKEQAEMFTAGRLDDFLAAFRAIAPGGFRVQDPATGPIQEGWDKLEALCREYAGWKLFVEDVKVSGNEAVIYVRNEGEYQGQAITAYSIEQYVFSDDGSLLARYFHPVQ